MEEHGATLSDQEREGLRDSMELMKQRYDQILQDLRRHKEVRNVSPMVSCYCEVPPGQSGADAIKMM